MERGGGKRLLAVAPLEISVAANTDSDINALRAYMATKYDGYQEYDYGKIMVYDLSFNPEWSNLELFDSPSLRRFLPNTRFYLTTLKAPHVEYHTVDTIASIRTIGAEPHMAACVSITYSDDCSRFLEQFKSVVAASSDAREGLALGISELLTAIIYKGRVGEMRTTETAVAVELWLGDLHWRNLSVLFRDNVLDMVGVWKP